MVRAVEEQRWSQPDAVGLDVPVESLEQKRVRTRGRELLAITDPDRRLSREAQIGGPIFAHDRIRAHLDVRDRRCARAHGFRGARACTTVCIHVSAARSQNDHRAQGQQLPPH